MIRRLQVIKVMFLQVFEEWKRTPNVVGWHLKRQVVRKRAQQCGFNTKTGKGKGKFWGFGGRYYWQQQISHLPCWGEVIYSSLFSTWFAVGLWQKTHGFLCLARWGRWQTALKSQTRLQISYFANAISSFPAVALQKNLHWVTLVVCNRIK